MHDALIARLGRRAAVRRRQRRLTTRQLAALAGGLSPTTICRLEAGHDVMLSSALGIASVLGISLDRIGEPCEQCGDQPAPGWACNDCGQNGGPPLEGQA